MRRKHGVLGAAVLGLCLLSVAWARASDVDEDLMGQRRWFGNIGPGLRAVKRGADGKYYVLASPNVGVAIFDANGKQLGVIGPPPPAPVTNKAGRAAIAFAEDCDVDVQGNVYVADRGFNVLNEFSPAGQLIRSIPVDEPVSVAALSDGEVAVTTLRAAHLVNVYGPSGKIAREFGDPEDVSTREELNRFLNIGKLSSDPKGRIYYGYLYLPEPLVRQYDRFGYAGTNFEFTGIDAYPEAQSVRKAIASQEKLSKPPFFHQVLTAFGVDPVSGDVWMASHNTLLHFDKDGNRRSEYRIYTKDGARLEANTILVEPERLLIGADPLGVYEFQRPDRSH